MSQPLTVECPTCGAPVEWKSDNKYRPSAPTAAS